MFNDILGCPYVPVRGYGVIAMKARVNPDATIPRMKAKTPTYFKSWQHLSRFSEEKLPMFYQFLEHACLLDHTFDFFPTCCDQIA